MADPYHHALSSVRKWGGTVADYDAIHRWFDVTKAHFCDFRHRAARHHAEGIALMEQCFGATITLTGGRIIPTRWVGEQHVREDLGFIPTLADWLACIQPQPWMGRGRKLSMEDVPLPTEAAGGPASGAGDGGQAGRQGAPTNRAAGMSGIRSGGT